MFRPFFIFISAIGLAYLPLKAQTIVQLDTPLGSIKFQLFDSDKPVTVANFLNYIISGGYENSFAHRYAFLQNGDPFVIQGGGFTVQNNSIQNIVTDTPIINEPGPFPLYSNVYGTLAMAKVAGDPNSATSQWFINLGNNSFLDPGIEGFTVFGSIIEGQEILDSIVQLFSDANFNEWAVFNVSAAFPELPLQTNQLDVSTLFYTDWTVIPEPSSLGLLAIGLLLLMKEQKALRRRSIRS